MSPLTLLSATFKDSQSFLVVREPMARLVAAYRNKLTNLSSNHDGEYFYRHYARNIIAKYRTGVSNLTEPTFLEFVDYLLNTKPALYDEHWQPIVNYCQICRLSYKYVLKYERFQEEIDALLHILEGSKTKSLIPWMNKSLSSENLVKKYLNILPESKKRSLLQIYKLDYILFQYDFDIYL